MALGIAVDLMRTIAELEAQRDTVKRAERKSINQRLHPCRILLRWCKTLAGNPLTPVNRAASCDVYSGNCAKYELAKERL